MKSIKAKTTKGKNFTQSDRHWGTEGFLWFQARRASTEFCSRIASDEHLGEDLCTYSLPLGFGPIQIPSDLNPIQKQQKITNRNHERISNQLNRKKKNFTETNHCERSYDVFLEPISLPFSNALQGSALFCFCFCFCFLFFVFCFS